MDQPHPPQHYSLEETREFLRQLLSGTACYLVYVKWISQGTHSFRLRSDEVQDLAHDVFVKLESGNRRLLRAIWDAKAGRMIELDISTSIRHVAHTACLTKKRTSARQEKLARRFILDVYEATTPGEHQIAEEKATEIAKEPVEEKDDRLLSEIRRYLLKGNYSEMIINDCLTILREAFESERKINVNMIQQTMNYTRKYAAILYDIIIEVIKQYNNP